MLKALRLRMQSAGQLLLKSKTETHQYNNIAEGTGQSQTHKKIKHIVTFPFFFFFLRQKIRKFI